MFHRKFMVACSVFFTILLFGSGCSDEGYGIGSSHDLSIDGGTIPPDATLDVETTQNKKELLSPMEIVSVKLAPQTCHGNRLTIPTELQQAAANGMTIWHLCYKTPTTRTSSSAMARLRPTTVTASLVYPGYWLGLVESSAPAVANPWTTSFLVALPRAWSPLFNFVNIYADETYLLAFDGQVPNFPEQSGDLQIWSVQPNGTQRAAPANTVCRTTNTTAEDQATGALPSEACGTTTGPCPSFAHMECSSLRPLLP